MHRNNGGEVKKEKVDLIIVGNQNSGKTSLIKRFVEGESKIISMQKLLAIFTRPPWE